MVFQNTTERLPNSGAATAQAVARAKPTILIAEDSVDSRDMMITLLRLKGFEAIGVDNGLKAVETALTRLPDMVLLDLQLPKLDGLAVARNLRRHPGFIKTPIVIVSGHDPATYRSQAIAAGCNEYLLKPIDFERLDQLLDTIP
jgi:two-component system cell cycle response regulator DivK